jgi:FkbM family methyltransferase
MRRFIIRLICLFVPSKPLRTKLRKLYKNTRPHCPRDKDFKDEVLKIDKEYSIRKHFIIDYVHLSKILDEKSTLFIDIGANIGQSARYGYKYFNDVKILSYEPLKSCLPHLDKLKELYPDHQYQHCAMGETEGSLTIKEADTNSGFSSILDLKEDYHYLRSDLQTNIINSYEVPSTTILKEKEDKWDKISKDVRVMKIDTQGTESKILQPAKEILKDGYIDVLMIEIMTIDKYNGQGNYADTLKFLDECGFVLYNITPIYKEHKGKVVNMAGYKLAQSNEFDFLFIHKNTEKQLKEEGKI